MTTNFQSDASRSGAIYETHVADLLTLNGWHVVNRNVTYPDVGVTIDILGATPNGVPFAGECKAGITGRDRPGLSRTDSLKKAIADAWLMSLRDDPLPYVVFTNATPTDGTGVAMLAAARQHLFAAVVNPGADPYWARNLLPAIEEWEARP